jgi:hypothetical protein
MSRFDATNPSPSVRWGLAVKLFAILALLGAIAVLVTSVLGYLQARDALQEAIYNQLTSTRKSKVQQVETYFRTIRNELSQLAGSKEAIDAARAFRATFNELNRTDVPADLRRKVDAWYGTEFMPGVRRLSAREPDVKEYLPVDPAAYYLQYHYIVANPYPPERRELVDDAGDGSAYSGQHAIYHPLLRDAATTFGFFDLMVGIRRPAASSMPSGRKSISPPPSAAHPSGTPISPWPSRTVAPMPRSTPPAWKTSRPMGPRVARRLPSWPRRSSSRMSSSAC